MKIKHAAFIGLAPVVGCGEPSMPRPLEGQNLAWDLSSVLDSKESGDWKEYLVPARLNFAWAPPQVSPWSPYHKNCLIASIAMVRPTARPTNGRKTHAEKQAQQFLSRFGVDHAAMFVDLPGPESVGWGAELARHRATPICTFNNWPHQQGVLRLEETLGALLYYANEMAVADPKGIPPVFMMESGRLAKDYRPTREKFDNRYFHLPSDFPPAEVLGAQGINVIYYVSHAFSEADDLHSYFLGLKAAGMQLFNVNSDQLEESPQAAVTPLAITARVTIFDQTTTSIYRSFTPSSRFWRTYPHYFLFWDNSRPTFGSPGIGFGGSRSGFSGLWSGGSS